MGQSCPCGSEKIQFHRGEKQEQRVDPNSASHKDSSLRIDYRKLNATTRKGHFPLSFIDKMLERLAGHEYYCFLDGYWGIIRFS